MATCLSFARATTFRASFGREVKASRGRRTFFENGHGAEQRATLISHAKLAQDALAGLALGRDDVGRPRATLPGHGPEQTDEVFEECALAAAGGTKT
jgi:hypothetical protein